MKVIIDECVFSQKFMLKLKKAIPNHEFIYLGRGLADMQIERYMMNNPDSVLITADVEFDTHFGFDRSILIESNDPMNENVHIVKAWLT